jgi:hypothetical protein
MATEKAYVWTPTTETGFMNDELDAIWEAINANDPSGTYVLLAGDEMTGELKLAASSNPMRFISSSDFRMNFRVQDGEGRYGMYWNTRGGLNPTFEKAVEMAGGIGLNPNNNIWVKFLHSGPGTTHNIDDPFQFERTNIQFQAGGFMSSLDLAATAGANMFESTISGSLRGSYNPWMEDLAGGDYRLMAQYKSPGGTSVSAILGDQHQHKYFEGYLATSDQTLTPGPTAVNWTGEAVKGSIFTHDNSTNPSRITVDVDGLYDLNAAITLEYKSTTGTLRNTMMGSIRINGTTTLKTRAQNTYLRNAESNITSTINLHRMLALSAGDYIEIMAVEVSNTGVTVDAVADETEIQLIYRGNSSA